MEGELRAGNYIVLGDAGLVGGISVAATYPFVVVVGC